MGRWFLFSSAFPDIRLWPKAKEQRWTVIQHTPASWMAQLVFCLYSTDYSDFSKLPHLKKKDCTFECLHFEILFSDFFKSCKVDGSFSPVHVPFGRHHLKKVLKLPLFYLWHSFICLWVIWALSLISNTRTRL